MIGAEDHRFFRDPPLFPFLAVAVFFSCADSDSDNRHPKSKPDFNRERASQKQSEASKKYSS